MSTTTTPHLIQARLGTTLPAILGDAATAQLPEEIQWMPPGTHRVTPEVGGKPRPMSITVDEALAKRMGEMVQRMREAAARGEGDVPYFDFNHDDGPAAAEVLALRWGGDDPKSGGIRARVTWTAAGRDALAGKTYRRFSPQWWTDPKTEQPVGVGVNLGGLVNRAAFQTIQPVVAKDAAQPETEMTEAEKNEFKDLLTSATKPLVDRITALETKASAGPDLSAITTRLKALEDSSAAGALASARARVQQFAAEGRLSPQDTDGIEAFAKAGAADPKVFDTLAKLPVNPAFKQVTGAAGTQGSGQPTNFKDAVVAAKAAGAKTVAEAIDVAMAKHPELYAEWRKAGGNLI